MDLHKCMNIFKYKHNFLLRLLTTENIQTRILLRVTNRKSYFVDLNFMNAPVIILEENVN